MFRLERLGTHFAGNTFGTQMERVRSANETRLERVMEAFGTQMERERSIRLFMSSTAGKETKNYDLFSNYRTLMQVTSNHN